MFLLHIYNNAFQTSSNLSGHAFRNQRIYSKDKVMCISGTGLILSSLLQQI